MISNKLISFKNIEPQFLDEGLNARYCKDILTMVKKHHLEADLSDKTRLRLSDKINSLILKVSSRQEPLVFVLGNAGIEFDLVVFDDYKTVVKQILDKLKDRDTELIDKANQTSLNIRSEHFEQFTSSIIREINKKSPERLFMPYNTMCDSLKVIFKEDYDNNFSLFKPIMDELARSLKDIDSRFSDFIEEGIQSVIMDHINYPKTELAIIERAVKSLESEFNTYIDSKVRDYKRGSSSVLENETLSEFLHRNGENWARDIKGVPYATFSVQVSMKLLSEGLKTTEETVVRGNRDYRGSKKND